jgi:hypothetical protein
MGQTLLDKYSWLHFATGIVAYFFRIGFWNWFLFHGLFEYVENTPEGVHFIDTQLGALWPGGKQEADATINSLGDQLSALLGYGLMVQLYGPVHPQDLWILTDK